MKKLCLIVAMMVAVGLVVGLYADSASAFFGGKFGIFGGGAKARMHPAYGAYGCYYPCYAPYWYYQPGYCGPRVKMKAKKKAMPKAKSKAMPKAKSKAKSK
ncbi:MAG: hypothetical protein P8182_00650 [Deltaproteobacteria bacterium]